MTSFSVDGLHGPPAWRDRLGAALLSVCAVGGIVAAISALGTVSDAGSATEAVETWRLVGFAFFAGIFVLLALAPRQLRGLWELTIAAKLALPVAGATFLRGSTDADTFVVFDGSVTVADRRVRIDAGLDRTPAPPLVGASPKRRSCRAAHR
jgi:hypothetical protein